MTTLTKGRPEEGLVLAPLGSHARNVTLNSPEYRQLTHYSGILWKGGCDPETVNDQQVNRQKLLLTTGPILHLDEDRHAANHLYSYLRIVSWADAVGCRV